ncbi:MAG: Gfo/Idh/MocA family oxidoreductase, partial [Planctomycetota bacterium]
MTARIGLLGPRRARQGLGPFLARFVEEAGGSLVAAAGRNAELLHASTTRLGSELGHPVRGYVGLDAMLQGESSRGGALEALVIASPIPTHEAALETALDAGLHVLCEKP